MSRLAETLEAFVSQFSSSHQLVLVGGLAVSARTAPRFTRDIDFCAAVADDAEAEAMIHAAQQLGYVVETAIEQVGTGRLATVRLRRGSEPIVDVRFASSGIEAEIAAAATELTVLGRQVRVAAIGHLIAMKLLSRDPKKRPRDEEDLLALARAAETADWKLAADAIHLISTRGFSRHRDLDAALAELRSLDLAE